MWGRAHGGFGESAQLVVVAVDSCAASARDSRHRFAEAMGFSSGQRLVADRPIETIISILSRVICSRRICDANVTPAIGAGWLCEPLDVPDMLRRPPPTGQTL